MLEGIKLASEQVGKGLQEFLADRERLTSAAVTLSAVALGVYTAKVSTGVAGRYIEARLGKPSLVRDTSRRTLGQVLRNPVPSIRRLFSSAQAEDALKGVVLEPGLTERLRRVAVSTANTKANGAPFRNLLLHGPPGTGTFECVCIYVCMWMDVCEVDEPSIYAPPCPPHQPSPPHQPHPTDHTQQARRSSPRASRRTLAWTTPSSRAATWPRSGRTPSRRSTRCVRWQR